MPSENDTEPWEQNIDAGWVRDRIRRLESRRLDEPRYEDQGEIARGGMGSIRRVWDEDLRRTLAKKVILGGAGRAADGELTRFRVLQRFLDEAQITGQLEHPGVVPVHELGIDESGDVYFTMRLVKGRDFSEVIEFVRQEGGWTRTRALEIVVRICETLAYAHSKGVIHRDLKPSNVRVGDFGEVYVMDWGLAKVLGRPDRQDRRWRPGAGMTLTSIRTDRSDLTEKTPEAVVVTVDGTVLGTPAYMSPEQAKGDIETVGPHSDVYSVGAMLYHLLSGCPPYVPPPGANVEQYLALVQAAKPEPIDQIDPDVPAELVAICNKAMASDIDRRYRSVREMAEDVRAFIDNRVVKAYRTGAVVELRKWVARNRLAAVASLGFLLALAAGLLASSLLFVESRQNEQRARDHLRDVLDLAQSDRLSRLRTRANKELWPLVPDRIPDMKNWLVDAKSLGAVLVALQGQLDRMNAARPFTSDQESSAEEKSWRHGQLEGLLERIREFLAGPTITKGGLGVAGSSIPEIERRLRLCEAVWQRSVESAQARKTWDDARAAIRASPKYDGLDIARQFGLLPIGADPVSNLWEFAHLATGEPPVRGSDGRLEFTPESGVVLVLIPSGESVMGSDPEDAMARPDEKRRVVDLSAFFIAKYEMTQAQWLRLTDRNPSGYPHPNRYVSEASHPIETVSYAECREVLNRVGLAVPSEDQWEYACRARSESRWWTGSEKDAALARAVNLADQAAMRAWRSSANWPAIDDWKELDDEWVVHCPVYRKSANPFGLHLVHGNVAEWCRPRPEIGVTRGGSFKTNAADARSACGRTFDVSHREEDIGVRPARPLKSPPE